jgi:hypothetical protein
MGLNILGMIPYSRSKSSNLSRYFMILRLILEESTHVTKSSMFLLIVSQMSVDSSKRGVASPCHQKCRVSHHLRAHTNVTLLDELVGSAHCL